MTCRRKGWGGPIAWFVRRRPWSHRSKGPPATAPATPSPKPDLASCPRGRGICRQYRSRPVPARRRPILGVRISPSEVELPDGSLARRRGGRHEKVVGIDKGLVGTPAAIEVVHEYRVEVGASWDEADRKPRPRGRIKIQGVRASLNQLASEHREIRYDSERPLALLRQDQRRLVLRVRIKAADRGRVGPVGLSSESKAIRQRV